MRAASTGTLAIKSISEAGAATGCFLYGMYIGMLMYKDILMVNIRKTILALYVIMYYDVIVQYTSNN